ncbi:MAG: GntR family transcriptional regulator, partial [Chloroflexi bacterium]
MKKTRKNKLGSIADIRSLTDQAYEIIKEAIVSLQLKPGERLKESTLAEELGISTTPIKTALARLEQEGFVEIIPFRGASVAQIDERDMEEIFELRELLEGAAVKKAALNFSSEDLQKEKALLEAMRETYEAGDIESYAESSREFHHLFIRASGNQRMINILKAFDDQLERIRRADIAIPQNIPLFIRDYEKVLEALRKKDPEEAER